MPHYPHGDDRTDNKKLNPKMRGVQTKSPNYIGRGVNAETSGVTPNESRAMGFNYGMSLKNAMGKMRSDSIGYIPVSREQLGTPPTSVV
jgi:hypothetical protein